MNSNVLNMRGLRAAVLMMGIATAMATSPSFAGTTCEHNDGDTSTHEVSNGSSADGDSAFACGTSNVAEGETATSVGFQNSANGVGSSAFGSSNSAIGANSTAVGTNNIANGNASVALGLNNVADGTRSVAIGINSQAIANDSVALGSGAVADRANTVSVGSAGNERQITNVADGVADTDAVNVRQLNAIAGFADDFDVFRDQAERRFEQQSRRIDRNGAMGAAMVNMGINAAGASSPLGRISLGVGVQGGESALSIGYGKRIGKRGSFSVGGASSGSEHSVGAGIGLDL